MTSDFLPRAQQEAFDQLLALAKLKMGEYCIPELKITPRVVPLIAGPTGAGKSYLAQRLAKVLGVTCIKVEFENWIPEGASNATPTIRSIDAALCGDEKLLVLIDEADKISNAKHTWSLSVQAEIWALLDRAVRTPSLLVICAGTWQSEHDRRSLGFVSQEHSIGYDGVPKEFRHRFSHVFLLGYPTPEETARIFESTGLNALAAKVGVTLDPAMHNWTGGMRSLERLCTDLMLKRAAQAAVTHARIMEMVRKLTKPATAESIRLALAGTRTSAL